MDFAFINEYMVPVVLVACLVVGYILKQWITDLENKYIPTILAVLGAVVSCVANNSVDLNNLVYGPLQGLPA